MNENGKNADDQNPSPHLQSPQLHFGN